jgi:hypothetical protein
MIEGLIRSVFRSLVQGLIWTAGVMFKVLHALNVPINVQEVRLAICSAVMITAASLLTAALFFYEYLSLYLLLEPEFLCVCFVVVLWSCELRFFDLQVCVFTAPLFSAFCSLAAYLLVKEIRGRGAGLTAAAFMAMVPSYISRSVAGSFDNEGVAIFALVFVFFLYVKVRG